MLFRFYSFWMVRFICTLFIYIKKLYFKCKCLISTLFHAFLNTLWLRWSVISFNNLIRIVLTSIIVNLSQDVWLQKIQNMFFFKKEPFGSQKSRLFLVSWAERAGSLKRAGMPIITTEVGRASFVNHKLHPYTSNHTTTLDRVDFYQSNQWGNSIWLYWKTGISCSIHYIWVSAR